MTSRARGFFLTVVAALVGCVAVSCALPQWRVFEKKIDPKLSEKPAAQIEGERQAASYIVQRSAPPVANPASAVSDIHAVATGLSASLGEPARPVSVEDKDSIISGLRTGLRAKEEQLEKWKAFGRKYAGKEIEDTGINLAGPAGLLALAGVVAACVACPALGYLLLRVVPLLWGFFTRTTSTIAEYAAEHPAAGEQLKAKLSRKMDEAHKKLVRRRKLA